MSGTLKITIDSIVNLEVDAIVNAANMFMLGGGGVDGAIHAAAGQQLLKACESLPVMENGIRCRTSEVRVTPGFDLPAKFVIHTVGPIYVDGRHGENHRLSECYKNCMEAARIYGCYSVAFPAISTGVFGYPAEEAAMVAYLAVSEYLETHHECIDVTFCCYNEDSANKYREILGANKVDVPFENSLSVDTTCRKINKARSTSDLILYIGLGKLPVCPVCGRQPKIKTYMQHEGGKSVIQCKSWFGRPHLKVFSVAADCKWAEAKAKKEWSDAVGRYKENKNHAL